MTEVGGSNFEVVVYLYSLLFSKKAPDCTFDVQHDVLVCIHQGKHSAGIYFAHKGVEQDFRNTSMSS